MKRRKPLRARSERRVAFELELDEITPALRARSRGLCELCGAADAVVRHHRLRRSQGGLNTLGNLLHLCSGCHGMIEAGVDPDPGAPTPEWELANREERLREMVDGE